MDGIALQVVLHAERHVSEPAAQPIVQRLPGPAIVQAAPAGACRGSQVLHFKIRIYISIRLMEKHLAGWLSPYITATSNRLVGKACSSSSKERHPCM